MCSPDYKNLIETVIDEFMDEEKQFTALNVTREVQRRAAKRKLPFMMHRQLRDDIHEIMDERMEDGYLQTPVRLPGVPQSVTLYYPEETDPDEYVDNFKAEPPPGEEVQEKKSAPEKKKWKTCPECGGRYHALLAECPDCGKTEIVNKISDDIEQAAQKTHVTPKEVEESLSVISASDVIKEVVKEDDITLKDVFLKQIGLAPKDRVFLYIGSLVSPEIIVSKTEMMNQFLGESIVADDYTLRITSSQLVIAGWPVGIGGCSVNVKGNALVLTP